MKSKGWANEAFTTWREGVADEVKIMRETACNPFSDNPSRAKDQLHELVAYFVRACFILAESESYLSRAQAEAYEASAGTVREREIALNIAVVEEQFFRDEVAGLVIGLDRATSVGQSSLRNSEKEYKKSGAAGV